MRLYLLSLLTILTLSTFSQNKSFITGSKLTPADAQKILAHHNLARKEVQVPPLVWNTALATYAQAWANTLAETKHCNIQHRGEKNRGEEYYGENIFWGSDTLYYKPINASYAWYEEKQLYHYTPTDANALDPVGHYTQMIWKTTTSMGAGMAVCKNGSMIIVANYDPPGNYIGKLPY